MAGRGGGAYINGRYVANAGGKKGGGRGKEGNGRQTGWAGEGDKWERKPGDEDVTLERKFDIDILQPGESRIGYLFNMKPTRHYDEGGRSLAGLLLYFLQRDGRTFRSTFLYRPYFFVRINGSQSMDYMKDILSQRFESEGAHVEIVDKEDLDMEDHIVGRKRRLLKLSFGSTEGHSKAVRNLMQEMKRSRVTDLVDDGLSSGKKESGSAMSSIEALYEYDVDYTNRVCIDNCINCGKWFKAERNQMATSADNIWDTQTKMEHQKEMLMKPGLRIFAWDIECTKEPLRFPDSAHDRITLISIMVDGTGFLIVNRAEVSEDIEPLEYTPKPEYEGVFSTYNEPDEASLLRRFFTLIRETNPHVMVTFNGDFFDMPFVTQRAKVYNMEWEKESGITKAAGNADYYVGKWLVHLDCFAWVQRDSYLPCGARGLKAVTRYKLKYDPVELDPEDMTPFAKERPQELAAYSVSDAVATYYLYMKYIHDFIFALCTIIPYGPDDVLRKGSGTLCESLLMTQAFQATVVFPNKHVDPPIEYHETTNRMIEQSTYEGARVECMRVGVYRADIKETFQLEPSAFQTLLNDLKKTVDFFLEVEESIKLEDVVNYDEQLALIEKTLRDLCDPDKVATQVGRQSQSSPMKSQAEKPAQDEYTLKLVEYEVVDGKAGVKQGGKKIKKSSYRVIKDDFPLIYHLDVGAMYPNIILSNRLQPSAIVSKEFCSACQYNDPSNNCKRVMDWKWRGELYMATRADVRSIINEMENEKRQYNQKDRDTGEVHRVKWSQLREAEQVAEINKAVRDFSQKAYRRVKSSVYEDKSDTVCQRENSFYVDTVRMFRDRRYEFKRLTKTWTKNLEKAEETGDPVKVMEAKDMVLLYDSLQLAHKCILNSFYGYVMRKGARWHSMKMAGIVTFTGSNLIREAREFCDMVGLPLELDTDGIWCLLPKSFPDTFTFKLKNGKDVKLPYPNSVLNYRVHQKYTNHQYQYRDENGQWKARPENSIFFEIDGPYKAMILPASTEEDKMLKKRYAVYNFDGSLAELKGFEVKRRGELRLIQVFQTEVFPEFLKGTSKQEVYSIVGEMANRWLDVIDSRGKTMSDEEVIYFFSESKSMSKSVEASGNAKSVQITCARRLAEFLGSDTYLTSSGLSCHMFIASKPHNASTTERAVPVKIFSAEHDVKKRWLQKWLQDTSLTDFDMRAVIDWNYYRDRLCAVFQKLICITAAYQNISNPCPRVVLPEWLRKRVAEQNDRFQQTSLGLWLRKVEPKADGGSDPTKRKLCDIEDLVGQKENEVPLVQLGAASKRWLEAHKSKTALAKHGAAGGAAVVGSRKAPAFGEGTLASLWADTLSTNWHIVSVELASNLRSSSTLRVGDAVVADLAAGDEDDEEAMDVEEDLHKGVISGFVGGLVRVRLDRGEERLLRQHAVKPLRDDALFSIWVAAGDSLALQRFELSTKRRVVIGLESEFNPEVARCEIRPFELTKGVQVWPRVPDEKRVGPGTILSASPEIGLCSVSWATNVTEPVFYNELEKQCGSANKVTREPPRNLQHACLVELTLPEDEFQRQVGEGALGDGDAAWPRVEAVYESEQPLQFDLICRVGTVAKLKPEVLTAEAQRRGQLRFDAGTLRFDAGDLQELPRQEYLLGLPASRNAYLHLCFDRAHPSRSFCGIFAPALGEAWMCFNGLDAADGEAMRGELEQHLSEQLQQLQLESASPFIRTEASFVSGRSLTGVLQWAEKRLQELKRRDGCSMCVLCSQLSTGEMRGLAPSFWVDQRQLRHCTALRDMPICRAPFNESDAHYPALDWPRWVARRFGGKLPQLVVWWRSRLALCRVAGLPICNAPELPLAVVPAALDALYARQLHKDSQLRWSSATSRPDLGETSLTLIDGQEDSLAAADFILKGKDLSAGRGGGQVNRPGVYRSICLEINLRTRLCVCALQHARYLSDREGGELSKKMIKKGGGADFAKTLDHTSEVSLGSFKSLVNMVHEIATACEAKEKEILTLRAAWVAQKQSAKEAVQEAGVRLDVLGSEADDALLVETLSQAGLYDAHLVSRLEELRGEHDAHSKLLDGLYGWLASETSLLYDPALLRKVHQYMDRVLQLFIGMLKKSSCSVIHASYSKVIFATGKYTVLPDVQIFWESLSQNLQAVKVLEPLNLSDEQSLTALYYGMLWMDPANWAAVPIDGGTGEISWKAKSCWKLAEFLPPAVRPSLILYAVDLLLGPQRELGRRYNVASAGIEEVLDAPPPPRCDGEEPCSDAEEMDVDAGTKAADTVKDSSAGTPAVAPTPRLDALEEVQAFTQGAFFDDLRRRVLQYLEAMQQQQLHELPGRSGLDSAAAAGLDEDAASDSSEDEEHENEGIEDRQLRKAERVRRHLEAKWSFPDMPGRRSVPGTVELEFMKALIQIFQLEESLTDQVHALRERMCQKLRLSSFGIASNMFENPCFPLILRDVVCPWCHTASHVDVTSHPSRAPGLWVCTHCERLYDKDVMQGLLVALLEHFVQAWQCQEVTCMKCRSFRSSHIQKFCDCFGKFKVRFGTDEFRTVFLVLRSLVVPHDLPWLSQMLDMYERMLP